MISIEPLEERLFGALCRYTSEPTARGIIRRARQRQPSPATDLAEFMDVVLHGARLFVEEPRRTRLVAELNDLFADSKPKAEKVQLTVDDEHAARRARLTVRQLAQGMGAKKLVALRAATALSELTRNLLMYAGRGEVEIQIERTPPLLRVVVSDRGPGIPDIEEILAGRYRSKTGLGRGITGVQKLADGFRIETGAHGTRVEFEVDL